LISFAAIASASWSVMTLTVIALLLFENDLQASALRLSEKKRE